ncbi:unnamed protein product, partial [Symbiodinium pilosum]
MVPKLEGRMKRLDQAQNRSSVELLCVAEEESTGTITPPEEKSPPPGKAGMMWTADYGPRQRESRGEGGEESTAGRNVSRSPVEPLAPPVLLEKEVYRSGRSGSREMNQGRSGDPEAMMFSGFGQADIDVTVACEADDEKLPPDQEAGICGSMRLSDSDLEGGLAISKTPKRVEPKPSAYTLFGRTVLKEQSGAGALTIALRLALNQTSILPALVKVSSDEVLSYVVQDGSLYLKPFLGVSALAKSRVAMGEDADPEPGKTPRSPGLVFEPFDSSLPLRELVVSLYFKRPEKHRSNLLQTVATLAQVVTANDILELCGGCVTKSSKEILENMTLRSILSKELSDFELDTTEDTAALEVMQKLLNSSGRAVPVLAQPDAPSPSYRTSGRIRILAQFDLAALWTVFGYKDDSDLWWWESEDVTSNIFLHSCVDFLAFGRKNSDGRDQAPVAKVSLDEKLSKVIGRACTSPFRHVVVYEEANDRQLRNPCCEISSHEFVQSLCGAGLLSQLDFNSCKPRPARFRRMFSSHAGITSDSMSKESSAMSPTAQKDPGGPPGTVSFNNMVEVEALVVPVCPVHHGKFMQYEALKELLADFHKLKELAQDPSTCVASCTAFCRSCAKSFGKVQRRPLSASHYKTAIKK